MIDFFLDNNEIILKAALMILILIKDYLKKQQQTSILSNMSESEFTEFSTQVLRKK